MCVRNGNSDPQFKFIIYLFIFLTKNLNLIFAILIDISFVLFFRIEGIWKIQESLFFQTINWVKKKKKPPSNESQTKSFSIIHSNGFNVETSSHIIPRAVILRPLLLVSSDVQPPLHTFLSLMNYCVSLYHVWFWIDPFKLFFQKKKNFLYISLK